MATLLRRSDPLEGTGSCSSLSTTDMSSSNLPKKAYGRNCICGAGLKCQGVSAAFKLLNDPRGGYAVLRASMEPKPVYLKHVFEGESHPQKYIALHHFHPRLVQKLHKQQQGGKKYKIPLTYAHRDNNNKMPQNQRRSSMNCLLHVVGKPKFVLKPDYPPKMAQEAARQLMHQSRESRSSDLAAPKTHTSLHQKSLRRPSLEDTSLQPPGKPLETNPTTTTSSWRCHPDEGITSILSSESESSQMSPPIQRSSSWSSSSDHSPRMGRTHTQQPQDAESTSSSQRKLLTVLMESTNPTSDFLQPDWLDSFLTFSTKNWRAQEEHKQQEEQTPLTVGGLAPASKSVKPVSRAAQQTDDEKENQQVSNPSIRPNVALMLNISPSKADDHQQPAQHSISQDTQDVILTQPQVSTTETTRNKEDQQRQDEPDLSFPTIAIPDQVDSISPLAGPNVLVISTLSADDLEELEASFRKVDKNVVWSTGGTIASEDDQIDIWVVRRFVRDDQPEDEALTPELEAEIEAFYARSTTDVSTPPRRRRRFRLVLLVGKKLRRWVGK